MIEELLDHPTLEVGDILSRMGGSEEEQALVKRAYEFAFTAHTGQVRHSGEPYVQHCLAVAHLLTELQVDAETLAAALLHDVIEDCDVTYEELEQVFGTVVARMVDGVTKLREINRLGRMGEQRRDERELESLRKSFMAMARDARVMLIKLADRLHNMRTLRSLRPVRRQQISHETMQIYAPLANRLGIGRWKAELEDWAFFWLEPEVYREISRELAAREPEQEAGIERHVGLLSHHLRLEGINADIKGRHKHIYSIYRKMLRKQVPLERVYDIRAIRVIVDSIPDCYQTMGVVHSLWTPIPGEFDDYIAKPKPNMYQSLHTAVAGMDGKTIEVQIRTHYMDRVAEYGVASHWRYKEGTRNDRRFEEKIATLRAQIEASSDVEDAETFVEEVTYNLFEDRVYTFTPRGKVIDLPAGATPIDFAYYVHTEVGHRARGAKVNGNWTSLDYKLKTGDQVEIVTAKRAAPSRDWLNPALGYVKTSRARSKIKRWFRQRDRDQNVALGRTIMERELKRLGVPEMSHDRVAELFGYQDVGDFLAAIGFGDINSQQIAARVIEAKRRETKEPEDFLPVVAALDRDTDPEVHVLGTGGLLTRLARCCNPIAHEPIVGYVTRGKGITIHRRDCPNVINTRDPQRLIEVSWGTQTHIYPVRIEIEAYDRAGLLHDISGVLSHEEINISSIAHSRRSNESTLYVTLEVSDMEQLGRVLARLNRVPNVIEARRLIQ